MPSYTEPDHVNVLVDRWMELSDAGIELETVHAMMTEEYPEMTEAEYHAFHKRVSEVRQERQADAKAQLDLELEIMRVCEPVWRPNPKLTMLECLDILIAQGSEDAKRLKPIVLAMPAVELPPPACRGGTARP